MFETQQPLCYSILLDEYETHFREMNIHFRLSPYVIRLELSALTHVGTSSPS